MSGERANPKLMPERPVVIVDAGHWPEKPGAFGNGLAEHALVWEIAGRIRARFPVDDRHVVLTRPRYWSKPTLQERVDVCNALKAEFFLSIHANAGPPAARGIETFHYRTSRNGKKCAEIIQDEMIRHTGAPDRGIHKDTESGPGSLKVLKDTHCPAVLVEVGFLTNEREAEALACELYIQSLVTAIHRGLLLCLLELGLVKEKSNLVAPVAGLTDSHGRPIKH